ncbi:MAG: DUF885 family protein [Candidatus Aminicenantaceae bacterium]
MHKRGNLVSIFVCVLILTLSSRSFSWTESETYSDSDYIDLVRLFEEFRDLAQPKVAQGVPDYTFTAMKQQEQELKKLQERLSAMNIKIWPVSKQVDFNLVLAELNGLEFHHRVLKPWVHNPGFYGTELIPGFPYRGDGIDVFMLEYPLAEAEVSALKNQLQALPKLLEQARQNLTDPARELAIIAIRTKEKKILMFKDLIDCLETHHPPLVPYAQQALDAVKAYRDWLIQTKDKMTTPAGVGKENFNWWMKNVWLYPHTWDECLNTALREYQRAITFLKLEENRNSKHPPLPYVPTEEEHARLWNKAEDYIARFVDEQKIFTVPDYLTPSGPHRPWVSPSDRDGDCAEFFEQAERHDPMAQVIHNHLGHHLNSLRGRRDHRPIRDRYGMYGGLRSEAIPMFFEEGLMVAGAHDRWALNPRSREVIYVSLAWRATRAIADLKLHSNEFTMEEALQHCVDWCPRGWECKADMDTWYDLEISMLQPGHATIYITGKNEFERLLADRAMQLGNSFNLQRFMDDFFASGMIPISLARWEMTGFDDEIKKLQK